MDQRELKYEKAILHIRYLFVIAAILAVIGVSLALGGDSDALGQISMASTVSSIILSSIAIFMSISGEYKLTYTHNKLLETSERMSNITANIEDANNLLNNTINQKFLKIDDIFNRLEQIGQSVDNVEKEVLNKTLYANKDSDINIPSDIIWQVYNEIINEQDDIVRRMIEKIIEYIVVRCSENAMPNTDNLKKYLNLVVGDVDPLNLGLAFGIFQVFISMGITKDETAKYIKERIMLSDERLNEIKKFL